MVECSLTIASLNDRELQFEALSYAWDDPNDRVEILVNGQLFLVTPNLSEALMTFRARGLIEGLLWVDAICTNQCDVPERGHQVSMMGTIYRRALIVHIWLGLKDERTQQTFEFIERAYSRKLKARVALSEKGFLEGLQELLSRAWVSRIWVVQEAIVARVPHVDCGNTSILFKRLELLIEKVVLEYLKATSDSTRPTAMTYDLLSERLDSLLIFSESVLSAKDNVEMADLMSIIHYAQFKLATDARDRIYALLGFLPSALDITPD